MKFVLIIILFNPWNNSNTISMQEFAGAGRCEAAKEEILLVYRNINNPNLVARIWCVQNGMR